MKNKLVTILVLLLIVLASCSAAAAESDQLTGFTDNQMIVYEAVKWNVDFPKNAQVMQATEYLCKVEGHQLHLLLLEATQNETIDMMFGKSSHLILIDLETREIITYANCIWPESSDITSKQDALNMIFSCYLSYLEGYNPQIYADHEITFLLSEEEISAVNDELNRYFTR